MACTITAVEGSLDGSYVTRRSRKKMWATVGNNRAGFESYLQMYTVISTTLPR